MYIDITMHEIACMCACIVWVRVLSAGRVQLSGALAAVCGCACVICYVKSGLKAKISFSCFVRLFCFKFVLNCFLMPCTK